MLPSDFHYNLPPDLIARHPAERRDASRLLLLPRNDGPISHHHFSALPNLLRSGDCLVVNDSRVIPARLRARRPSGGHAELLLIKENPDGTWQALTRPARKLFPGMRLALPDGASEAEIVPGGDERTRHIRFHLASGQPLAAFLDQYGEMPLPPYILQQRREHGETPEQTTTTNEDRERYQTIYAQQPGSAAAPTAGLHFTPELIASLATHDIELRRVTLHVGLGTFQPLAEIPIESQKLHAETYAIDAENAAAIEAARRDPARRVIAVGTTSVRTLEACFAAHNAIIPTQAATDYFIYPGYEFKVIDGLVTNFHLPGSSLLMLVAALVGRERVLAAYAAAIRERYRFFSYGDAMVIL